MSKTKKLTTNGTGVKPMKRKATPKVEFLPLIPIKELEKKKDLTPEEALMLAWDYTYRNRHKRIG